MDTPGKPLKNRRHNGEYSTIRFPDGMIETMWFGEDGSAVTVGRTFQGVRETAEKHIEAFELQQAADAELAERPASLAELRDAEAAEYDVKLILGGGKEDVTLTGAGRVYVHSLRMEAHA